MSKAKYRRAVGARLRAAREAEGMGVCDAADFVGVSASALSQVERGVNGLTVEMLVRLCQLYEVSSDWILELKEAP